MMIIPLAVLAMLLIAAALTLSIIEKNPKLTRKLDDFIGRF